MGDHVVFKNAPKKKQQEWEIIDIETNLRKIQWTKGGHPNFVRLRRVNKPDLVVWTCSNQLQSARFNK